jgi:arsenate reductase
MAVKVRILFVSSNGGSLAFMAEGFARYFAGSKVVVESAAPVSPELNPYCQWAMNETGIDVSNQSIELLEDKDLSSFTHLITLDKEASESLTTLPATLEVEHWDLPDPEKVRTRPAERIMAFRALRNELERRIRRLLDKTLRGG